MKDPHSRKISFSPKQVLETQPFFRSLSFFNLFKMKFFIPCIAAIFATGVLAAPTPAAEASLEQRADRGQYSVPGLGAKKQAILKAGGNSLDMAIAMLEM
jgi:hypothetical protein